MAKAETQKKTKPIKDEPKFECLGGPLDGEFFSEKTVNKTKFPSGHYELGYYIAKASKIEEKVLRWISE